MKPKIYTKTNCKYCKDVKEFFNNNNIEYDEINIEGNDELIMEVIEKTGHMQVPVIETDDTIIIGYNHDELQKLIN